MKGTAIRTLLEAVARCYGDHGRAQVLAALPTELRAQLSPMILASKQYPIAISAHLQEAVRRELGRGDPSANRKVGAAAARIDFGGVYSAFLRVASFETMLRGLERAWRQYNSHGTVHWDAIEAHEARGRIEGTLGYTEPMWQSIAGRIEEFLVMGGAKTASVELVEISPTGIVLVVRWTK